MKGCRYLVASALALAALSACSDQDTQRLTLTGSSTVAPLVNEIARRYEATHPQVRIDVQTGGSTRGVRDARAGLADIGMASRALRADESDLVGTPIARDGITIIVHADNPVQGLEREEIRAIYGGEIDDWSAVGGKAGPITVIHKADGRSTQELFLQHFGLGSADVKADIIIGDNKQGLRTLVSDPSAIGYVSIGAAEFAHERGEAVRLLALEGVPASTDNVRTGRFPLARPLTLVTNAPPEGLAADFIDYARSAQVHDLVRKLYFVPLDG
ncbi:phosphate ABC transporter substrate-binding protein [Algiphilus sp.]|uniref:phosphate ABC transporter substrate-binding protein n=1 Tax=Algiphilus sp. TaxID=1872431 RepID=UPI003B51A0EA